MSYSHLATHGPMVFDEHRNRRYASAMRKVIRPGSVVLDLGAGLGIHGLLAAAAGAGRVYLVEPQPMVHVATKAAHAAGLADRIVIIQSRIEDVELPEPVDAIISVFTGNLLFSEDLLPSLFHARDRYLKAGGALLPDRAQLWLAPLCAPDLHDKHVRCWSTPASGLDFSAVRCFAANEILWLRRQDLASAQLLGTGSALADVDLSSAGSADCRGGATCRIEAGGTCHGLLGWIRIRLGEEWLSTGLDSPEVHWSPVMLPIDPPLQVIAGEQLRMTLQRPDHGDWTWSVSVSQGERRHSTFLSSFAGPRELARSAPEATPGLAPRGLRALRILQMLSAGCSIGDIAFALAEAERLEPSAALREVQVLSMRFGRGS